MFSKLCEQCPKNEFGFDRNAARGRVAAKRERSQNFLDPFTELVSKFPSNETFSRAIK